MQDYKTFLARARTNPWMRVPPWGVLLIEMIGEMMTSSQADADALKDLITSNNAAWKAYADNAIAILTNVEKKLADTQAASGVDLSGAISEAQAGQQALSTLPVEVDPTVPVTPPATP